MLLEVLLTGVLSIAWTLLGALPDPGPTMGAMGGFVTGYQLLNIALPLDTALLCFGITLGTMGAMFPQLLAIYLYRLIPFKAS